MACDTVRAMLLGTLLAALTPSASAIGPCQEQPATPEPAPLAAPDPAAAQRRVATLHDGALADTRNGDGLIETEGYRRLLQIVSAIPADEMIGRITVPFDYARVMQDPDAFRGEYVRARGLLIGLGAERLDRPLDGIEDAWRGTLVETDGSDGIVFDMLSRPEGLELEHDVVDVEGVFYRVLHYESQAGKTREVPYLIARSVTRVDTSALPSSGLGGGMMTMLIVGAAVVFVVARLLMLLRDRSGPSRAAGASASAIRRAAAQHKRDAAAAAAKAPRDDSSNPPGPPAKLP